MGAGPGDGVARAGALRPYVVPHITFLLSPKNSLSASYRLSIYGASLVVVISLDEEPRAPLTPNINLVAVEAKALTMMFCQFCWRGRTCHGRVGSGVVDCSASHADGEDIVDTSTAGGPEGHKGLVDPKCCCGGAGGGQCRCSYALAKEMVVWRSTTAQHQL